MNDCRSFTNNYLHHLIFRSELCAKGPGRGKRTHRRRITMAAAGPLEWLARAPGRRGSEARRARRRSANFCRSLVSRTLGATLLLRMKKIKHIQNAPVEVADRNRVTYLLWKICILHTGSHNSHLHVDPVRRVLRTGYPGSSVARSNSERKRRAAAVRPGRR